MKTQSKMRKDVIIVTIPIASGFSESIEHVINSIKKETENNYYVIAICADVAKFEFQLLTVDKSKELDIKYLTNRINEYIK